MRITLREDPGRPYSEQLAGSLAERIRRGSLGPGARLPTVRALASDLGLAPNTVAKAYRALERERLVVARGRHGTFVVDRLPARVPERERHLAEAAEDFARRGRQLGFRPSDLRRALDAAVRRR